MKIQAMVAAIFILSLSFFPSEVQAKVYHAEDYIEARIVLVNESGWPRPKMYPGGSFWVDVKIHSKIKPNLSPGSEPKGIAIVEMDWKVDWEKDFHIKEWSNNGGLNIIWENSTVWLDSLEIKIPKDVRLGIHNITFIFEAYLFGGGWGSNDGTRATPLKTNYTFYVKKNPQSTSSSTSGFPEGNTVTMWLIVAGTALVVVVVISAVIIMHKRSKRGMPNENEQT